MDSGADEERGADEGISRRRIASLSDLIFGLALSISALTLIGHQPASDEQFFFSLAVYGFSFLVLMGVWRAYSRATSALPIETGGIIQMNVVLLFCVSVEPYLFNELFATHGSLNNAVSSTFAADIAVLFFVLAFFANTLADEEKELVAKASLTRHRRDRTRCLVVGLMFVVSAIPYFDVTNVFSVFGTNINVTNIIWFAALAISYSTYFIRRGASPPTDPTKDAP